MVYRLCLQWIRWLCFDFWIFMIVLLICFEAKIVAWSWPPFPISQCLQANTSTWCKRGGRHLVARVWLRGRAVSANVISEQPWHVIYLHLPNQWHQLRHIWMLLSCVAKCWQRMLSRLGSEFASDDMVCSLLFRWRNALGQKYYHTIKMLWDLKNLTRPLGYLRYTDGTGAVDYDNGKDDRFSRQMPLVSAPQSPRHYPAHPLPAEGNLVIVDVLPDNSGTWRCWKYFWTYQVLRMFQTHPRPWA